MSNHYHLVLKVMQERCARWSEGEVIERWTQLFARPPLIERWQQGQCGEVEREVAMRLIALWRVRLADVSWYMRCMNEHLARRANHEDGCKGRFWEGRFKSQALLDEAGLLTAMVYVDLNPIRAGIATLPETSEFTSIYERLQRQHRGRPIVPLLDFQDHAVDSRVSIPFSSWEYLALVDWTGRARVRGKCGSIDEKVPALAQRLNIDARAWQGAMQPGGNVFGRALGRLDHLRIHANALGQSWVRGLRRAERMYGAS